MAPQHAEDGVLEAVLFSMGRTMTQEEVKHLMQRTVQQVASTLSLDLDRAEHLLVHCKWNVDLLIQRYTDDPDTLVLAAGLKIRNPQPPPSPAAVCPVCLISRSGESESAPTLCCMHYCCKVSRTLTRFRAWLVLFRLRTSALLELFNSLCPSIWQNRVL